MNRVTERAREDGSQRYTRRTILRGGAATVGGVVAIPGLASGRRITQTAVIPSPEDWADENLAGFMIHAGQAQDPVQTREAANCNYENWPPDEIRAYDAQIINRKDADTPEQSINLHIDAEADVPPGALYLINAFERCDNGYIGVSLEQIGQQDVGGRGSEPPAVDVEDDSRPNTQTERSGAIGPGFGALATIAALVGGGLLARLIDD